MANLENLDWAAIATSFVSAEEAAQGIAELFATPEMQDLEVEVFFNSNPLGYHTTVYVIDTQIKGLGKKDEG